MNKFRIGQKLSLAITLIIISNIMTGVTESKDINYYLFNVLLTSLLIIPLLVVKKDLPKSILSAILLFMSFTAIIDINNDISNMNGFFYFLMSASIAPKSIKIYILYFSVFTSALLYKFNILDSAPSQVIGYIGGLLFIGFIYEEYIYPRKRVPKRNIDIIPIDQEEKAILQLWCRGYSYDEISKTLSLNILGASVRRKITSIMATNKKKNDAQFVKWLYENV